MQKFEKHSPVVVTEVTTKHELRQFMQYPNRLYADNPNYIPSFYGDDLSDWTPGKNPAFDYCEARCWLARRGVHVDGIQLLCTPETLARAIKMSPSGHRAHP